MSLSQLLRNAKKASATKAAAAVIVAGAVGFTVLSKTVDSNGNVVDTSTASSSPSSSASTGATGFATSNPALQPASSSSTSSGTLSGAAADAAYQNCMKNPTIQNCSAGISQSDWDSFLPPEGLVIRDGRGNIVFKKCRSLTEGAQTAKNEMDQEKARFAKFTSTMNVNITYSGGGDGGGYSNNECLVQPSKSAPMEQPCPSYQNLTDLRDYYRQQYYEMSNKLQALVSSYPECTQVRDNVMAAVDPNWKSDRGIASSKQAAAPGRLNTGVR